MNQFGAMICQTINYTTAIPVLCYKCVVIVSIGFVRTVENNGQQE